MSDATIGPEREPTDIEGESLAGAAGEDFSAGISTSGAGGVNIADEPEEEDAATSLDAVVEGGRRLSWGHDDPGQSDVP